MMIRKPDTPIEVEFIRLAPDHLRERTLYISMEYASAIHSCFCGCGYKVVTPLSPAGWQLYFDGRAVTLTPSIGNWAFPCKSHYWITNNSVRWAEAFTDRQIDRVKKADWVAKQRLADADAEDTNITNPPVSWREKWRKLLRRKKW